MLTLNHQNILKKNIPSTSFQKEKVDHSSVIYHKNIQIKRL